MISLEVREEEGATSAAFGISRQRDREIERQRNGQTYPPSVKSTSGLSFPEAKIRSKASSLPVHVRSVRARLARTAWWSHMLVFELATVPSGNWCSGWSQKQRKTKDPKRGR